MEQSFSLEGFEMIQALLVLFCFWKNCTLPFGGNFLRVKRSSTQMEFQIELKKREVIILGTGQQDRSHWGRGSTLLNFDLLKLISNHSYKIQSVAMYFSGYISIWLSKQQIPDYTNTRHSM